jgi:hypothetical protein
MRIHPAAPPRHAALFDPGTALLVASSAVGAIGAIKQGNDAAAAGNFNAAQLESRAQTERDQAAAQAQIDQQNTRRRMGEAYAAAGASGIDPSQGSPLSVMSDLAAQGELTRRLSLYRGDVAATGDLNQAAVSRYQGKLAQQAGMMKGVGILVGNAAAYGLARGFGATSASAGPSYSGATGPYGYNTPGGLRVGGTDYAY